MTDLAPINTTGLRQPDFRWLAKRDGRQKEMAL